MTALRSAPDGCPSTIGQRGSAGATAVTASASPRVSDLLDRPSGSARVVHSGRDAVYLDVDGWCLGVVSSRAWLVPCALVTAAPLPLSNVVDTVVGTGGVLLVHDTGMTTRLRVTRLVDRRVPPLAPTPSYDVGGLLRLAGPALAELGADAEHVTDLIESTPERLIGRGSGLTPLGDDVLAGWAATSFALGEPMTFGDARPRTSLLSATLLDCAQRGEVLPQFRALVFALAGSSEDVTHRAASDLSTVGHTSGAGLLLGLALRLRAAVRGRLHTLHRVEVDAL